jgi:choline dehydrogenase-like flavoprotein
MGAAGDLMAVVDTLCRVNGVERLRVIDASCMPTITSGNTNAPTIMLAQVCADVWSCCVLLISLLQVAIDELMRNELPRRL